MKKTTLKNIIKTMGFFILMPIYAFATTGTMVITSNTVLTGHHYGKIIIQADGVKLNCKGFRIKGTGTGYGVDIVKRKKVLVTGCNTEKFGVGFRVLNSRNITLTKNSSSRNTATTGGFIVRSSSDIRLRNNFSHNNIKGRGFSIDKSKKISLIRNSSKRNGFRGIEVGNSKGVLLQGNKVRSNGSAGVVIYKSFKITMTKNAVSKSASEGIAIIGTKASKFLSNDVSDNGTYGFRLTGSIDNTFKANKSYGNVNFDMQDSSCPNLANTWISNGFNSANCPNIN